MAGEGGEGGGGGKKEEEINESFRKFLYVKVIHVKMMRGEMSERCLVRYSTPPPFIRLLGCYHPDFQRYIAP